MQKFAIFKRKVTTDGLPSVSFTTLPNPGKVEEPLFIEAENIETAASKAGWLLQQIGINIHTKLGDPDLVLYDSVDYFVAAPNFRDSFDDSRALYRVHKFEPVNAR